MIVGYQDMLIYSRIANIISISLKLHALTKKFEKDTGSDELD